MYGSEEATQLGQRPKHPSRAHGRAGAVFFGYGYAWIKEYFDKAEGADEKVEYQMQLRRRILTSWEMPDRRMSLQDD
ncbi:hypothetical protein FRC0201_02085 [Corynebacterium diphtheriae]|nr:hypothetical protein FRC0026_02071 [Corynebacterium diphtheriae]CAB0816517.1 hypothetical protein FRC0201_02085 [Corynebacterium diphtheriae]CAB0979161.1 hypothetical protein FRC0482_02115 [Corynebacterium diphtheriae]CAB1009349.1 hypothetical protein FRC0507_02046 [Corynebacterium diphtheriae]